MNKLFFTSLFLLFSSLSFFGQKRDYLAEMYANHHGIAQKAGTNNLLKEFIKPYGKKERSLLSFLRLKPVRDVKWTYLMCWKIFRK